MIRQIVSAAALSVAFLAPLASHASLFARSAETPSATTVGAVKGKMVKLTLKNNTASAMTVYANDQTITLAANGGTQQVKLPAGSDVMNADRSTVKLHVTSELGGNTVSFR